MRFITKISFILLAFVCFCFFIGLFSSPFSTDSPHSYIHDSSIVQDEEVAWAIFADVVDWNVNTQTPVILNLDYSDSSKSELVRVYEYLVAGGTVPTRDGCSAERFIFLSCYQLAGYYYTVLQDYTHAMNVLAYLFQNPSCMDWAYSNMKYEWFDAHYLYGYACAVHAEYDKTIHSWQEMLLHLEQFPAHRPTDPEIFNYILSDLQSLVSWKNNIKGEFILSSEKQVVHDFLVLDNPVKFSMWDSVDEKSALSSVFLACGLYDAAFSLLKTVENEIDDIESLSMKARLLTKLAQSAWYSKKDSSLALEYLLSAAEICPHGSLAIRLDIQFWLCQVYYELDDVERTQKIITDILNDPLYTELSDPVSKYYLQQMRDCHL